MAGHPLLTRTSASDAVEGIGWRYLLGTLACAVPVPGLAEAVRLAGIAAAAGGADVDAHLRMDLRPDRLELSVQTRALGGVTAADVGIARAVTAALAQVGVVPGGPSDTGLRRPLQVIEVAVDAVDIPAVRPFWQAVLGYVDDPAERDDPTGALVDPAGQLPAVWFQQMNAPARSATACTWT